MHGALESPCAGSCYNIACKVADIYSVIHAMNKYLPIPKHIKMGIVTCTIGFRKIYLSCVYLLNGPFGLRRREEE